MADKKDIKSVDDLAGKTVAVQSGSTGPKIVADVAPDATLQEFKTDEEARKALEPGPRRCLRDRHHDADGHHGAQPQ